MATVNFNELENLGFKKKNGQYIFITPIYDGELTLKIVVKPDKTFEDFVIDENGDLYTLYKVSSATGEFVGKVREEVEEYLEQFRLKVSGNKILEKGQREELMTFIENFYNDSPEYLWESDPSSAIYRNEKNKKWYALFSAVTTDKLGLGEKRKVNILNIKVKPDRLKELVDNIYYFPAWHMNKKHWMTIILDRSLPTKTIIEHLRASYDLVK